jgi:hypothetical protein
VDKAVSRNYGNSSGLSFPRLDVFNAIAYYNRYYETLTVSNTGDANLTVHNITYTQSWVHEVIPNSFFVEPNKSEKVLVYVNPYYLNIGVYTDTLTIFSNDPDDSISAIPLTLKILSEGCTGDCPPPASGDWVIDQDTYLYQTPANVDGKVTLQGGVLLYIGETHVNVTNTTELDGAINLDNGVLSFN